jgi:hypothetical protein
MGVFGTGCSSGNSFRAIRCSGNRRVGAFSASAATADPGLGDALRLVFLFVVFCFFFGAVHRTLPVGP